MRLLSLLPIVVFSLTSACTAAAPLTSEQTPMQMRSWELPEGQAERLAQSLNRVLIQRSGDNSTIIGRASDGPRGTLVVVAPSGVMAGVDTVVRSAQSAPPAAAPRNVNLDYAVVLGRPGGSGSGTNLEGFAPALEAIQAADGPMAFELRAARTLSTLDGHEGQLRDSALDTRQVVAVEPGTDRVRVTLELTLGDNHGGAQVRTALALESGEVAVLAHSGVKVEGDTSALVYVLVRPTLD